MAIIFFEEFAVIKFYLLTIRGSFWIITEMELKNNFN